VGMDTSGVCVFEHDGQTSCLTRRRDLDTDVSDVLGALAAATRFSYSSRLSQQPMFWIKKRKRCAKIEQRVFHAVEDDRVRK